MKVTRIALRLFLWTATTASSTTTRGGKGISTLAFGAASIVPKKSSNSGGAFAQQCIPYTAGHRDHSTRRCLAAAAAASGGVQFPFLSTTAGLGVSPLRSNYQNIRGGGAAALSTTGSSTSLFSSTETSSVVVDSTMETTTTTTTTTPVEIFRKDYRPLEYTVRTVSLDFSLHPGRTVVTATMTLQKNPKLGTGSGHHHNNVDDDFEPFALDGDASAVQLLTIALNGRALTANVDYILDPMAGKLRFIGATTSQIADGAVLTTTCQIVPETNTQLSGLYQSDGGSMYCTQCEAMGFRRITYYPDRPDNMAVFDRVRIEADATLYPLLLSNGNLVEQGTTTVSEDGGGGDGSNENRHYAVWSDPYPKPCYLFAVVAGNLDGIADTFVTKSGRTVALRLYSEPNNVHKLHYAMSALKRSMKWDEERYGVRFFSFALCCVGAIRCNLFDSGAL
jgi:Peptidase M1 N-terminal domain